MSDDEQLAFWIVGGILVVLYMLPTIIAFSRGHSNRWFILVVNLVFGGTGFGWLGSLIWALHAVHRSTDLRGSHGGESGLNIAVNDPIRIEAAPSSGLPLSSADRIEQLHKLKLLRDDNIIDQAEFDTLRRELLSR